MTDKYLIPSLRRVAVGLCVLSFLFEHVFKVCHSFVMLMFMGHWVFRWLIKPVCLMNSSHPAKVRIIICTVPTEIIDRKSVV